MSIRKLDIIAPAYREEENIEKFVIDVEKSVKIPHHLTIVLQDKHDPTAQVLGKLFNQFPSLRIIYTNNGVGMVKALKRGFEHTKSEFIVITMADLSDNPKDIDKMVKKLQDGYDLVCASRYMKSGKRIGGQKIKEFLSYSACATLRKITGITTTDATNAYKAFKYNFIKKIKIESKQGFEMPLELSVKAYKKGYKIADIPTIWRDREKGKSKFRLLNNLKYYLRWYIYGLRNSI